jgi:hypothetical protein
MGFFRPEDCEELQQLRIGSFLSNESPFPTTKKPAVSCWMESLLEFGGTPHWTSIWMYSVSRPLVF